MKWDMAPSSDQGGIRMARTQILGLLLLLLSCLCSCQVRPRNYSPDAIPETPFSCEDKVTGGYYADVHAECQLFHVCVQVSEIEFQDFRFLCPNDTVFDQQNLVCTNWFDVDCEQSVRLFFNDFGHKQKEDDFEADYEDEDASDQPSSVKDPFLLSSSPVSLSGPRGTGEANANRGLKGNVHALSSGSRPFHSTTALPIRVVASKRPPRVKSDLLAGKRNKQRPSLDNGLLDAEVRPDGKRPRVKSDLSRLSEGEAHRHKTGSRLATTLSATSAVSAFDGPEVRPDGRAPRVKANLLQPVRVSVVKRPRVKVLLPKQTSPFVATTKDLQHVDIETAIPANRAHLRGTQRGNHADVFNAQRHSGPGISPQIPALARQPVEVATINPIRTRISRPLFSIPSKDFSEHPRTSSIRNSLLMTEERRLRVQSLSSPPATPEASSVTEPSSTESACSNPFRCPRPASADGRRPRVKANIKASERHFFQPAASNRISGRLHQDEVVGQQELDQMQVQTRTGKALQAEAQAKESTSISEKPVTTEAAPLPSPSVTLPLTSTTPRARGLVRNEIVVPSLPSSSVATTLLDVVLNETVVSPFEDDYYYFGDDDDSAVTEPATTSKWATSTSSSSSTPRPESESTFPNTRFPPQRRPTPAPPPAPAPMTTPDSRIPRVRGDVGVDNSREGRSRDLNNVNADDEEPVVRPDGRRPRVKADLIAKQRTT